MRSEVPKNCLWYYTSSFEPVSSTNYRPHHHSYTHPHLRYRTFRAYRALHLSRQKVHSLEIVMQKYRTWRPTFGNVGIVWASLVKNSHICDRFFESSESRLCMHWATGSSKYFDCHHRKQIRSEQRYNGPFSFISNNKLPMNRKAYTMQPGWLNSLSILIECHRGLLQGFSIKYIL